MREEEDQANVGRKRYADWSGLGRFWKGRLCFFANKLISRIQDAIEKGGIVRPSCEH